jgi:hypothetical protein
MNRVVEQMLERIPQGSDAQRSQALREAMQESRGCMWPRLGRISSGSSPIRNRWRSGRQSTSTSWAAASNWCKGIAPR